MMAVPPSWHCDAIPVLSNSGVEYPWQVQPLTLTGAPPPFPGTCPLRTFAAYSFSTRMATLQSTVPLETLIRTGTSTAVRVLPQVAPAAAASECAADEHPAPPASSPATQASSPARRAVHTGSPARPAVPGARTPRLPPVR